MPYRQVIADEMGGFLNVISHCDRIRIIQELRTEELEVSRLREALKIAPSRLSQHLALLKAHYIVKERREGRKVIYSLRAPEIAKWLLSGMRFLQLESQHSEEVNSALDRAIENWETPVS
jgi:DNA-binding transcriptional ArsR family regulator